VVGHRFARVHAPSLEEKAMEEVSISDSDVDNTSTSCWSLESRLAASVKHRQVLRCEEVLEKEPSSVGFCASPGLAVGVGVHSKKEWELVSLRMED